MSGDKLERRKNLDPAVADILDDRERRQEERQLPKKERDRIVRERKRAQERLPARVSYDLPPEIKQRIKDLAGRERVPESQLAALALSRFLADVAAGRVNLTKYKRPTKSPKYDWLLEIPSLDE